MKPCWAVITSPGVINRGVLPSVYNVAVWRDDAKRRSIFVVILVDRWFRQNVSSANELEKHATVV